MKIKIIAISGVAALAAIISACGGGATNTTNSTNTANANKPANTANTTTNASNSSNSTSNSTSETNKDTSSSTTGDVVNFDPSGIKMNVPKGWGMSRDGDALTVTSPDKTIVASFVAMEGKDFEAGTMKMAQELDKAMKDVKVEQNGTKDQQDGMDVTLSSGTGVDKGNGENIVWLMASIKAPKKPVLITIVGEKDNMDKHKSEFGAMLDSIKKQ